MRALALPALALLVALAVGCGERSQAEGKAGEPEADAVTVTVANVAVRPVERTVSVVGTLAADAQAELASEVEGQVVEIVADLGDRVSRGDVLARVRRDEIDARLRESEASLEKAIADETRAKPLREQGVISTQEYDQVRTSLQVARARRDQLRIQLEHTEIRSPLDASVAARLVDKGSYVRAGTVIYRLVQDDPLKFRGEVPEREVPSLQAGQEIRIVVDAFPGETFLGRVARIGSAADPTARSLAFEAGVPNADHRLRPGFFGHGEVVVGKDDRALAVPLASLTSFAGVTKVFVIENGVAHERQVVPGVDLGDGWVELAQGITQGKQVATSGLSKLAEGTRVVVRTDVAPGA
jgi:membrane fusion protein (multidrug efflux system)